MLAAVMLHPLDAVGFVSFICEMSLSGVRAATQLG